MKKALRNLQYIKQNTKQIETKVSGKPSKKVEKVEDKKDVSKTTE